MKCVRASQTCQFRATPSDSELWIYCFLNLHGMCLFDHSLNNCVFLFRLINAVFYVFKAYDINPPIRNQRLSYTEMVSVSVIVICLWIVEHDGAWDLKWSVIFICN
jgi:hypothetical protein